MARAKENGNGRLEESTRRLEEAMQMLLQNQAIFVQSQASHNAEMAELKRTSDERFARIESILIEHNRIMRALPDAIRDKIGFKPPEPSASEKQ